MTPREGLPITLAQLRAEFETAETLTRRPRVTREERAESQRELPVDISRD